MPAAARPTGMQSDFGAGHLWVLQGVRGRCWRDVRAILGSVRAGTSMPPSSWGWYADGALQRAGGVHATGRVFMRSQIRIWNWCYRKATNGNSSDLTKMISNVVKRKRTINLSAAYFCQKAFDIWRNTLIVLRLIICVIFLNDWKRIKYKSTSNDLNPI